VFPRASIYTYTFPYLCCYPRAPLHSISSTLTLTLSSPSSSPSGYYFTGDGCRRDGDGYYWITGRVDDVINPSGHRIGTAEVESALVACPEVSEAAVVGFPHELKGEGICCYVILREAAAPSPALTTALKNAVRAAIGPIATPDIIIYSDLPKTRSGKIMRRILRKVAAGEDDSIGDVSTLADPSVVPKLVSLYKAARLEQLK
jgi:acetyl-CoA synthetase